MDNKLLNKETLWANEIDCCYLARSGWNNASLQHLHHQRNDTYLRYNGYDIIVVNDVSALNPHKVGQCFVDVVV